MGHISSTLVAPSCHDFHTHPYSLIVETTVDTMALVTGPAFNEKIPTSDEKMAHEIRPMPSFTSSKTDFHRTNSNKMDLHRTRTGDSAWTNYFLEYTSPYELENTSQLKLVERTKSHDVPTVMPAATQDPRDPLNYPLRRKLIAVFFLCFFGALAAAAELILGALLPVFVLQYAGIDPKIIGNLGNLSFAPGTNVMAILSEIPSPEPEWKVYLLGSLPVLIIGVANMVMIPLATAVGRRPVILTCGVMAVAGCIWSGNSASLDSHLLARCLQAVGAGTVESLIPFVISDLTFTNQRNTWMSFVFATQGFIIVGLGFSTPYVIIDLSWRWMYFITAIGASVFLVGVFIFLPETRWQRTQSEMSELLTENTASQKSC